MGVDSRLEVLDVPEAAGHLLDRLNLAVDTLAHGIGNTALEVGSV